MNTTKLRKGADIRGSQKNFSDRKKKMASAEIFFWGPPRGPPKFCQKPSLPENAHLCKVLFHFHSKLRLGPKSGFRKIDFSTTKRPLNIFLSIRNDSLADSTPIKRVISKTRFSRFLDTLTLFGRFEISTPKIDLQNRQTPPYGKNRKIDFSRPIFSRF